MRCSRRSRRPTNAAASTAFTAPWITPAPSSALSSPRPVVKMTSSVIGGTLSDRFGRRAMIGLGWFWYAVIYGLFGFADTAAIAIVLFLSYGLYFGLTEGVEKAWVVDLAPAAARGT